MSFWYDMVCNKWAAGRLLLYNLLQGCTHFIRGKHLEWSLLYSLWVHACGIIAYAHPHHTRNIPIAAWSCYSILFIYWQYNATCPDFVFGWGIVTWYSSSLTEKYAHLHAMPESRHNRANRAMPSLRQTNAGNGHQDRTHKIHVGPADESAEAQPFRALDGFCAKSLVFFFGVQRFRSIGVGWLVGWLVDERLVFQETNGNNSPKVRIFIEHISRWWGRHDSHRKIRVVLGE